MRPPSAFSMMFPGLRAFHDCDAGICRARIDTNYFRHFISPLSRLPGPDQAFQRQPLVHMKFLRRYGSLEPPGRWCGVYKKSYSGTQGIWRARKVRIAARHPRYFVWPPPFLVGGPNSVKASSGARQTEPSPPYFLNDPHRHHRSPPTTAESRTQYVPHLAARIWQPPPPGGHRLGIRRHGGHSLRDHIRRRFNVGGKRASPQIVLKMYKARPVSRAEFPTGVYLVGELSSGPACRPYPSSSSFPQR